MKIRLEPFIIPSVVIVILMVVFLVLSIINNMSADLKKIELRADLVELIIASDPTLSNEEIKHKVNDLYKFIVEDEK